MSLPKLCEHILFKTCSCFRKNNYLRSLRSPEDIAHHEEGRDSWAQATVGMSPTSCLSPALQLCPDISTEWEEICCQRTWSDVFYSCSGSPPSFATPASPSLETTFREKKLQKISIMGFEERGYFSSRLERTL